MKTTSVVVSVYNEEKVLNDFYKEMKEVLNHCSWDHEFIFAVEN